MIAANFVILVFGFVWISIGALVLYFSSPSAQKKYNPDNK